MSKIDWTKWSAIAEILSAISIVVTLLYLSLQTRYLAEQTASLSEQTQQNNLLMRSQTRSDISNTIVNTLLGMAHSDHVDEIRSSEVEEAGGTAAFRQLEFELANLRIWENIHYQWRNGLYDDSEFEAEKRIWAIYINRPATRAVYCEYAAVLSPDFRMELARLLDPPCS